MCVHEGEPSSLKEGVCFAFETCHGVPPNVVYLPKICEARLSSCPASSFVVEGAPKQAAGPGEGAGWPPGPAAALRGL